MKRLRDFPGHEWPEPFKPGQFLTCDRNQVPVSAEFARARLRAVIAADRAPEPFRNGHWQDRELRRLRVVPWFGKPSWLPVYRWEFHR